MIPISISEGTLCSLLRLLIQMLISSRNTITDTPRPSEHPLAQLRRQVTLRCIYINIYVYMYIYTSVLSCARLFATLWTVACQAPLSWDFPGKNPGLGCHFLLQGNLPSPGVKPASPALLMDSVPTEPSGKPIHSGVSLTKYVVVQSLSHVRLCNPTDNSTAGFPVLHYLPEFAETHIHWVGDTMQPSYLLLTPSPPTLNLSQHQGLFQMSLSIELLT